MKTAKLAIKGLSPMTGVGIGASGKFSGELVFNTAMSGYPEALTDPSYQGQILLFTFPLIGNYGISKDWFESNKLQPVAIICSEIYTKPIHYHAIKPLEELMLKHGVGGMIGVDTRYLTKVIRNHGTVVATLTVT